MTQTQGTWLIRGANLAGSDAGTTDLLHPEEQDDCVARAVPVQLATRQEEAGCSFCADPPAAGRIQICTALFEDLS